MIPYGCSTKKVDISVIVPLYKGNKYINNIRNMVKKNSQVASKQKIELIFVNDYPDDRIVISQEKDVTYDIFIVSNEKNYGIQKARIEGLKRARGQYILFLDQDDKIADNYLCEQLRTIGQADAVVCNGVREDDQARVEIFSDDNRPQFYPQKFLQNSNCIVSPGQVLIRKTSIPRQWTENIIHTSGADDYYLWMLMMLQNAVFLYDKEILYTHVEHRDNFSKKHIFMRNSLLEVSDLLKRKNCENNKFVYAEMGVQRAIKCEENYIKLAILATNDAVENFMKNEKINKFAVYGYGRQGKALVQTLQALNILPSCIIERRKDILDCPFDICNSESDLVNIDLLIITPVSYYKEIKEQFRNSGIRIILSMDEFLNQCINNSD